MSPSSFSSFLPLAQLRDPAIMLETLQMAYRFMLDEVTFEDGSKLLPNDESRRLDLAGQRELGRRLAAYHLMGRDGMENHAEEEADEVKQTIRALHDMKIPPESP